MKDVIRQYLEDAIAAEKSFETQLRGFAEEASNPAVHSLFDQHADETRQQYEELTTRLHQLGGSTSIIKSMLAHLFNSAPKVAQAGHTKSERTTQDLMMAFAVENAEVAMYEALTMAAETAGDDTTATLARKIQSEEKATAAKVWSAIAPAATQGYRDALQEDKDSSPVLRYLQDAEAAERNFEDALASFGKSGEQAHVQSLMNMMSDKAKTQHQRLAERLQELGGKTSGAKSTLAHVLAFTPLTAQIGHDPSEKSTQQLMVVYAAAAAEMAMYEALGVAATQAGDSETAGLARQLQAEEQEDHKMAWENLAPSARATMQAFFSHA